VSAAYDDLVRQGATPEEAAAALAAVLRHVAERAAAASPAPADDRWTRAARLAAVGEAETDRQWADPHPWGRSPQ
jgi:hypothetical protein